MLFVIGPLGWLVVHSKAGVIIYKTPCTSCSCTVRFTRVIILVHYQKRIGLLIFLNVFMCFSDYLFKLLLIGDSGVGKSCLLLRFAVSIVGSYLCCFSSFCDFQRFGCHPSQ